ncbi:SGNH/GDSL hydrolase family protein [Solidesulfovibrio fructosivorans]|nr:DUF459 domain-containing protein [Solidesulfovibrio fructosivorans]
MLPTRFRIGKSLFFLAALVAMLCGAPSAPYCDPVPAPRPAGDDSLRTLVASLDLTPNAPQAAAKPDLHAVRETVAAYQVRLTVDKEATHPLSGPVAVNEDHHLGGPGRRLRLVTLAALDPPAPEPAKAAPAARPAPIPRQVAVKKTTSPAPAPVAKAAAPRPSLGIAPGRSVLVAGDSLSIFLANALRPMLAGRPGTSFTARGKVSSGLARPDFFDWEREMAALAKAKPDTVVIMIAANDDKTMTRPDGKKVAFGRPGWNAEYARRVRRLVTLARSHNPAARIYWVGSPVMANPRLNADVAAINAVIAKEIAALPGCQYVDVWRTLADASGHYARTLPAPGGPRTARTPDGVHLTPYGAKLLANAALTSMSPAVAQLDRP